MSLQCSTLGVYAEMGLEERLIYFYLVERAAANPKLGLTQQELSRHSGLSLDRVRGILKQMEGNGYLKVTPSGKRHNINLLEPYHEPVRIPFTYEDTDDRRIIALEKEVLRLSLGAKENTRLSTLLKGERAEIVSEIERYTGGLTLVEAYMIGQAIALVGPERLKKAWRTKAHEMKNPVRDICSMLLNKAYGASFTPKDEKQDIVYRKLTRED